MIAGWFTKEELKVYRYLVSTIPEGGKFVELGVWLGQGICSVSDIILNKNIVVYAVDVFDGRTISKETQQEHLQGKSIEGQFLSNIRNAGLRIDIDVLTFKYTTDEASTQIEDRSIDLTFVDANHSYESTKKDNINYLPKIKPGGIISGHDYKPPRPPNYEVKKAVDEVFGRSKILRFENSSIWFYKIPDEIKEVQNGKL